jgi:hypothetical protein
MSTQCKSTEARPRSPLSLQFVNATPQSEMDEMEKASLRKLVRANATFKSWRRRKKATALARLPSQSTEVIGTKRKQDQRSVGEDLTPTSPSVPGTRKRTASTTVRELLQISASNSMSSVGIGHFDPFEVYPSELPMHIVSPALARR